jgi:Domain of unknown function (DUF6268)
MIRFLQEESSTQDPTSPGPPPASHGLPSGPQQSRIAFLLLWRRRLAVLALFLSLPFLFPSILAAREAQGSPVPKENLRYSLSGAPIYQFPSKVDGGGTLSVFTLIFNAGASKQVNDKLRAGVSFTYMYNDYHFSGLTGFSVPYPWSSVHTFRLAVPLYYSLSDTWNLLLIPMAQFSGENGARFGDALAYGGVVGISYVFGPKLELGLGIAGYYDLAEVLIFPYPIVKIKLSDRFRVSNPFQTSPAGPAGVEVSYVLNDHWDVGFGWAYRSPRFRLDYNGPIPNGIGEYRSFPVFARLSYKLSPALRIDGYGGASFLNKIYINDRRGNELYRTKQNVAPLIGLAVSGNF